MNEYKAETGPRSAIRSVKEWLAELAAELVYKQKRPASDEEKRELKGKGDDESGKQGK